jgi:hypothetical protein
MGMSLMEQIAAKAEQRALAGGLLTFPNCLADKNVEHIEERPKAQPSASGAGMSMNEQIAARAAKRLAAGDPGITLFYM